MLTYLNVRNYGYTNMKATGALFSPGSDSSGSQCKEDAKEKHFIIFRSKYGFWLNPTFKTDLKPVFFFYSPVERQHKLC